MASVTEHRCVEGGWKPGPVKGCTACKAKRPVVPAKRYHES